MAETIERQAAIDALDKRFESFIKRLGYESYEKADEKTKLVCDGISEAMDAIMDLPPAQPTFDARDTQYNLPIGTDCISRQAAIDAVRATLLSWSYMPEWRDNKIIEAVEQLPSAQPEIVRCKDCKYWIPYDWMFGEVWQSRNIADYPEDEIGCKFCDMTMKADDFK